MLPDVNLAAADQFTSQKECHRAQKILNPYGMDLFIRDKGVFYKYCMALGIRIPKLLAFCNSNGGDWSYNGSNLAGSESLSEFIDMHLPDEFVIKPARGSFGRGVQILRRSEGGFVDTTGLGTTAEQLTELIMVSDEPYIIQNRVFNHDSICELIGTEYLRTSRIISFLDDDGSCRILYAHFKLIPGEQITDNLDSGETGNIKARIDVRTGKLLDIIIRSREGLGIKHRDTHPDSGRTVRGFQLPDWDAACKLITRAAPHFWPMRALGWDVAHTPDGPVIIETNGRWHPPNTNPDSCGMLMQTMFQAAGLNGMNR